MSAEDLENYETEMELQLYREYRDVVGLFTYVVETERRFYLANHVDLQVRSADGEVYFEVVMNDAWVWDVYRPARFVKYGPGGDVQGRQRRGAVQERAGGAEGRRLPRGLTPALVRAARPAGRPQRPLLRAAGPGSMLPKPSEPSLTVVIGTKRADWPRLTRSAVLGDALALVQAEHGDVTTGPAGDGGPGVERRLVLDEAAWLALCEAMPQVAPALPEHPGFAVSWNPPSARARDGDRAAARRRLVAAGAMDRLGRPAAALVQALSGWAAAPLRVRVRSWLGDRAVWAELGVAASGGVGLARTARVEADPGGRPVVADQGEGIELSFFPAKAVVEAVERALPEPALAAGEPDRDHGAGPPWGWEESIAVAGALTEARVAVKAPGEVPPAGPVAVSPAEEPSIREEILDEVLAAIKPHGPPPVAAHLAARLSGAIDVRVDVGTGGGRRRWRGLWLISGPRLVAVLPAVEQPAGGLISGPGQDGAGAGSRARTRARWAGSASAWFRSEPSSCAGTSWRR